MRNAHVKGQVPMASAQTHPTPSNVAAIATSPSGLGAIRARRAFAFERRLGFRGGMTGMRKRHLLESRRDDGILPWQGRNSYRASISNGRCIRIGPNRATVVGSAQGSKVSLQKKNKRISVVDVRRRKGGEKLVCLTAYTAPVAELLDGQVDVILVGDSLGMVIYGLPTTVGVTVEMMIQHGRAVASATNQSLVAVDLPFGSYERSPEQAHETASRIMRETGCQAVKVEACEGVARSISFLARRGIPVIGHVGLRPQAANVDGGFKVKGRSQAERDVALAEATEADKAGAFAIVVEGVTPDIAQEITSRVSCPTIGIGASPNCDGQILVTEDMLGLFEWAPKFVRHYASMRSVIRDAVAAYSRDVRCGNFPKTEELYIFRGNEA